YYRARYYSPYLGRFLQRDPLGESASLNLYAYVLNNPVNGTDPSGMMTTSGRLGQYLAAFHGSELGYGNNQTKMEFRGTRWNNYTNAEFSSFEEAQADSDRTQAWMDNQAAGYAKMARVAAHNVQQQVDDSLKLSKNNIANPKGVVVIFNGHTQN